MEWSVVLLEFEFAASFGSKGKDHGKSKKQWDISFDSKGDLYVADSDNHRIQVCERHDDEVHFWGLPCLSFYSCGEISEIVR